MGLIGKKWEVSINEYNQYLKLKEKVIKDIVVKICKHVMKYYKLLWNLRRLHDYKEGSHTEREVNNQVERKYKSKEMVKESRNFYLINLLVKE